MGGTGVGVRPSIFTDPQAALNPARRLLASDPAAAARQARHLLHGDPANAAALRLLGAALRRLGQDEEAERAELDAIAASAQSPGHREAARAIAGRDHVRATAILKALLAEDKNDVAALVMLGMQATAATEFNAAEPLLRKAVALAPADPSARTALAELNYRSKRPANALAELDQLKSEAAETSAALSLRARILGALGRQEEEVDLLNQLIERDPDPRLYLRLGHALRTLGRIDEAVAAYRANIIAHPNEGSSWWSLANLKSVRFSDADIAAMERGLAVANSPVSSRIRLHFALGKANEDRGQPEAAFRHYVEGNRLRASTSASTPASIGRQVDRTIALYTAQFFADRHGSGYEARDPIFIVGLQRSGSTLVEQILASHPEIEGTAELTDMPSIARELGDAAKQRGLRIDQHLASLTSEELRALGQPYLDRTRVHRTLGRPFFTDKMPNNWLNVGLIRLVLPNARIVDVRRNPMACCFSNFKQLYGMGLDHTNSLETMGQFYADYVRLMRHFDAVQPGAVYRLIYDRLVDDLEGETRKLLDYLGFPFDPACLAFHANARAVRTISAEQVRRPINREGLDQWRAFEPWLNPLKQALGLTLTDWENG